MNTRSAAESALSIVQDAADTFLAMGNWIKETEDQLNVIVSGSIDQSNNSVREIEEPRLLADGWSSLAETRSLRLSKLTVRFPF